MTARSCPRPFAQLAAAAAIALLLSLPSVARGASCVSTHWIGAWAASPSDASGGTGFSDLFDASGDLKRPVSDETIRAVLTPTHGGSTERIHLSNRFGTSPAVFAHVTIAIKGTGAALAGSAATVRFGGNDSVTVAPGQDVVSDAVNFRFGAMRTLAVSMYVSNDAGRPTEHYTARQTSYLTAAGGGNHATDTAAGAFTQKTTTRPYVDGVDVVAPASAGAVVAFGDSITDGYQGQGLAGVPEVGATVDANGRWPDDLARRLIAARIPMSVLNAGISGNRVLLDGAVGGHSDTFGPAALTRLGADVLRQSGVTTVIWLEGINDLGQTPNATAAQLEAGWRQGTARMHAAGLRVLQGTLTPSGGANGAYGASATNRVRQQLNTWVRTRSPADGVIDFDAGVRDPRNPGIINPAYDGGDHLHFNLAGYRAMANKINLARLQRAACTAPALRLTVTPSRVRVGTRIRVRFRVTMNQNGHRQPVGGVLIMIGAERIRTNRQGTAALLLCFTHAGRVRVTAMQRGKTTARATITVVRRTSV